MSLPDEQQELLVRTGLALCQLQTAEKIINSVLTFVIQKDSPLTLEKLTTLQEKERTATLGYFIKQLKKRVDIEPTFEAFLDDFLKTRNEFIHEFFSKEGWDFQTPEGRLQMRPFLDDLLVMTDKILKVFMGIFRAWQKQVGLNVDTDGQLENFAEHIDQIYVPLAYDLFSAKQGNK